MDITPPKTEKGIQRLKEANRNSSIQQPDRTSAYPPIESSETHHETEVKPAIDRRRQQRRQTQRRQQESGTQYDTRSGTERRQNGRRHDDLIQEESGPDNESGIPRIDEKV